MRVYYSELYLSIFTVLFAIWYTYTFHTSAQSGFYIDYLYKRGAEYFVRNVFVYSAQFMGEKFMIEQWTKIFFFFVTNNIAALLNIGKLNYFWFFFQLLVLSFYLTSIFFIFCLLL